jgi:hypothetical protein
MIVLVLAVVMVRVRVRVMVIVMVMVRVMIVVGGMAPGLLMLGLVVAVRFGLSLGIQHDLEPRGLEGPPFFFLGLEPVPPHPDLQKTGPQLL